MPTPTRSKAEGSGMAGSQLRNEDLCGICGDGGDLLCCDGCPKAFHFECVKVRPEDLPDTEDWFCNACQTRRAAQSAAAAEPEPSSTAAAPPSDAVGAASSTGLNGSPQGRSTSDSANDASREDADVRRISSGRSLSNSAMRSASATGKTSGRVRGPTSALSSFLREKGIVAPPRGARWMRREPAPEEDGDTANGDDDASHNNGVVGGNDDDPVARRTAGGTRGKKATWSSPSSSKSSKKPARTQETRKKAVAAATERTRRALAERAGIATKASQKLAQDDRNKHDDNSDDALSSEAKHASSSGKRLSLRRKRKKVNYKEGGDSDDDDGNDDFSRSPPRPSVCGSCGKRVAQGILVCAACRTSESKKSVKRRKKAAKGSLLHELQGSVQSLQDMCVGIVCKYIDCVDEFGDLADDALDRICKVVCRNRQLNDETMRLFARRDRTALVLADCANVSEEGLRMIAMACPGLEQLTLINCGQMSNDNILELAKNCKYLTRLELTGCFRVSDETMAEALSHLPHLQHVHLACSDQFADKTLTALARLGPGLESLSLHQCLQVTDTSLESLSSLKSLKSLRIERCEQVSDDGVKAVLRATNGLQSLSLSGLFRLTDDVLPSLADLATLSELDISHLHKLTDSGILEAGLWKKLSLLRRVNISRCIGLTDDSVVSLVESCPLLERLCLNSLDAITDDSVRAVQDRCRCIRELDLSFCRNASVTDEAIDVLFKHCEELRKVVTWGCLKVTETSLRKRGNRPFEVVGCAQVV